MLLPNYSVVPCPCPELSCGLSSSGAVWEEQENPWGSQSLAELWEGPRAWLWIWEGRCLAGRAGDTGVSPPSLSLSLCPLLLVSCWAPSPVPRSALWNAPPAQPGACQSSHSPGTASWKLLSRPRLPVRTSEDPCPAWIAAAVVAAGTSPNVPLLGGCGRECRTIPGAALSRSLCLVPWISSVPSLLAPGWGWGLFFVSPPCSSLSLVTFPWGWSCLCPSRDPRHRGAAGLLEALQEGSAVSFGSPRRNFHLWEMSRGPPPRHKHFPLR